MRIKVKCYSRHEEGYVKFHVKHRGKEYVFCSWQCLEEWGIAKFEKGV